MLPKNKRLNLKKDFTWVASGQRVDSHLIKLLFRFGDNPIPRVGISLSKTVSKRAVDRNRARRIVSSGFEALYFQLPSSVNIVALPKKEVLSQNAVEFTKELEELLRRSKLLVN